jgi:hypothetical protein
VLLPDGAHPAVHAARTTQPVKRPAGRTAYEQRLERRLLASASTSEDQSERIMQPFFSPASVTFDLAPTPAPGRGSFSVSIQRARLSR